MIEKIDWESLREKIERKKVVGLPDIFLDHLIFTDSDHETFFESIMTVLQGKARNIIAKQQLILGGNAFNIVLTTANLGVESRFIGSADSLVKTQAENIAPSKLKCMITEVKASNITTSFEIGEKEKKNVMFSTVPALSSFNFQALDVNQQTALVEADAILVSNWGMAPHGTELLKDLCMKKKPNQLIFFDPADVYLKRDELPELLKILEMVDFLSINEFEYLALNQVITEEPLTFDWLFAKEKSPLQKQLSNTQIIIHTANRVFGWIDNFWSTPTFAIPPQFSTGLGDTFLGGFATGILGGLKTQQAAVLGAAVAGYFGVNGQRPTLMEVQEFIKQTPLKDPHLSSS